MQRVNDIADGHTECGPGIKQSTPSGIWVEYWRDISICIVSIFISQTSIYKYGIP